MFFEKFSDFIFIVKDPHWPNLEDPDPQKVIADPLLLTLYNSSVSTSSLLNSVQSSDLSFVSWFFKSPCNSLLRFFSA